MKDFQQFVIFFTDIYEQIMMSKSAEIYYIYYLDRCMFYQKKRRKLNLGGDKDRKNEESTQNSQNILSNEKHSQLSKSKKKSFTKIFIKRVSQKDISEKSPSLEKIHKNNLHPKDQAQHIHVQTANDYFDMGRNTCELIASQREVDKQKFAYYSNTNSTCSLQLNNPDHNGLNTNRKKFKLYCQVKKKKVNDKKSQLDKQTDKLVASSTFSESWIKNSVNSKNSEHNKSNSTQKSHKQTSVKRKINLSEKIKQIKSKQKHQISQQKEKQQKSTPKTADFQMKDKDAFTKISEQSPKRSNKSLTKKHSTVNIKRSTVLSKMSSKNEENDKKQQSRISIKIETDKDKEQSTLSRKPVFKVVQNKILPEDSQIIEESVKKLSQIRQEKNEDTISRSLKPNDGNSMQNSVSKSGQQTMMHLSINSICRDSRRSLNCILETTQMRESNLRRSIQSSLSELQKSRQKINIEKFKQPKTIGEMGSQISQVQQNMTTIQKIEFHIELINTLSNFVYKSTELQYLMEDWDELNFLIYKKFYLERMKVLNFLKKYPIKNPFCIKRASIQTKQVLSALRQNQLDIKRIKNNLEVENVSIKKNLQVFYNQFSQDKHGQKINLFEYDNFSHWIYKQLWDQIQLFSYSQSHNRAELQDRICKSLQAGFLISELNGNFVTPFEDAQVASHQNKQRVYIEDNLKIFQRYVLNKKK